jgi:serine/threonine protein phosphatase PrpC
MRCTYQNLSGLACEVIDIQPGDNFCYICGQPVAKELKVPSRAVPSLVEPAFKSCFECGGQSVNDKGYCKGCGILCRPALRDNFQIEMGNSAAVRSNVGKVHAQNDDFAIVTTRIVKGGELKWLVVCDGLSQSQNPHLASEVACKAASKAIEVMVIDGNYIPEVVIKNAFNTAQTAVLAVPEDPKKPAKEGIPFKRAMTTIVIALVAEDKVHLGWAGDSRVYAIYQRDGRCGARKLTRDDTGLEKLRAQGMPFSVASKQPRCGEMTQCLGPIAENGCLVPNYGCISLQHVAAIVGCTDGAYTYFDPGPDPDTEKERIPVELAQVFASCQTNALSFADRLINIANERGGQDNITVAALFLSSQSQGV